MPAPEDPVGESVVEFYEFRLDRNLRLLTRNGERLELSRKPFDTLEFLVRNRHKVSTKAELLATVWGNEYHGPNVVEQMIAKLRRVLGDSKENPRFIETAPLGYRFIAPVKAAAMLKEHASPTGEGHRGDITSTADREWDRNSEVSDRRTVDSTPTMRRRFPWLTYASVASLFIVAVGISVLYSTAPGEPAACEVTFDTLIAKDGQGREVWRRQFREHLNDRWYATGQPFCEFADLDGDGIQDVLFNEKPAPPEIESGKLYGFITRSKFLRGLIRSPRRTSTFVPGAELVVGPNLPGDEYVPPYGVEAIFPNRAKGDAARVVVSSGMGQATDQIAVLDGNLKKLSEYWHTGTLRFGQFASYEGKERLYLAGVNNGYRSATVVVFDPERISGATDLSVPGPDLARQFALIKIGTREHLRPFRPGTETCRALFERTCIARVNLYRKPYNRVRGFRVTDDRIVVGVTLGEVEATPEFVTYELDRHFNLVLAYANGKFQDRHRELERQGLLDHTYSDDELKPLYHVMPGCEFGPLEATASSIRSSR